MPLQTVFIYGTVKTGQSNHDILNAFEGYHRLIGLAQTVDSFPLVVGGDYNIPFLLHSRGRGFPVEGELYEMDESKLTLLDALNRHPHFYERLQEKVRIVQRNEIIDAWLYAMPKWAHSFMSSSSPPLRVYNEDEGTEPLIVSRVIHDDGRYHYTDVTGRVIDERSSPSCSPSEKWTSKELTENNFQMETESSPLG